MGYKDTLLQPIMIGNQEMRKPFFCTANGMCGLGRRG